MVVKAFVPVKDAGVISFSSSYHAQEKKWQQRSQSMYEAIVKKLPDIRPPEDKAGAQARKENRKSALKKQREPQIPGVDAQPSLG